MTICEQTQFPLHVFNESSLRYFLLPVIYDNLSMCITLAVLFA